MSRGAKGFTLLEIMVALAVLALALLALLTLRNRDVAMRAEARHLVTATALAQAKLEEVSRVQGARDQAQSGDAGEHYPGYTWRWSLEPVPLTGWLELLVQVAWHEGNNPEQVELVTYVKATP